MVAGLLLTGGQGRRLGIDKSGVRIDGETLAAHGARVLRSVCHPVLEVGPGASELEAVREEPAGNGPLAALVAGADALTDRGYSGTVLLLAVDMPFVEPPLLQLLTGIDPAGGVVLPWAVGQRQPLCAVYGAAALDTGRALLADGARALQSLLDAVAVREITEDQWRAVAPPNALDDVDTPEDAARSGLDLDAPR
jgi:molybdopterin-guanine dinucleotide biosynthesis protein A